MQKRDYKKELKHLYKPSAKKVVLVDVSEMNFLMVDGQGDPNTSPTFQEAVNALYPLAYALKFMIKRGKMGVDYGVLPLEGLWWSDDMVTFSVDRKEDWHWTLMIMQPEYITEEMVALAKEEVARKKNSPALSRVRFASFREGRAVQILHIGPFAEEGPTIAKIHRFIEEQGEQRTGRHHEIYLSDIRKAAPENWKTVIRQPCCKAV